MIKRLAMSSKFFKDLYYPASETKEREISNMQPKTFRKILDYLFRGSVPLSPIEDAWKVKVAGRTFKLKELEDLCTKFLQYASQNGHQVRPADATWKACSKVIRY